MAEYLLRGWGVEDPSGFYEVRLKTDGRTLEFVTRASHGENGSIEPEPGVGLLTRLGLFLLSAFVSEDLL